MHDVSNMEAVILRFGDMRCRMTKKVGQTSLQHNARVCDLTSQTIVVDSLFALYILLLPYSSAL
jgi:hypothetical protein